MPTLTLSFQGWEGSGRNKNTVHKGLSGLCGQARNGQPCGRSKEATSLLSFPDGQEETGDASAMGEGDQLTAGGRRLQGAEPPACKRMLLHRE